MVLHPEEGDVEQKFSILVSVSPLFNRTQFVLVVTEASMEQPASLLGGVPLEFYAEKVRLCISVGDAGRVGAYFLMSCFTLLVVSSRRTTSCTLC